jgi:phenylpyruvate tautomerase PptA (4-oxalocrotonate tautomerase family)
VLYLILSETYLDFDLVTIRGLEDRILPELVLIRLTGFEVYDYSERRSTSMPVVFIEAPPGIRAEAKRKMVEKVTTAIDEAYQIGDTLVFLREFLPENVAMDGRLQSENPKILETLKKIGSESIS